MPNKVFEGPLRPCERETGIESIGGGGGS